MADNNEPREETLEQRIKRWARDGIQLSDGKVVTFNAYAIRLDEFREYADAKDALKAREIGDKMIAACFGLDVKDVKKLALVDFRALDAVLSAMVSNPVEYHPN